MIPKCTTFVLQFDLGKIEKSETGRERERRGEHRWNFKSIFRSWNICCEEKTRFGCLDNMSNTEIFAKRIKKILGKKIVWKKICRKTRMAFVSRWRLVLDGSKSNKKKMWCVWNLTFWCVVLIFNQFIESTVDFVAIFDGSRIGYWLAKNCACAG